MIFPGNIYKACKQTEQFSFLCRKSLENVKGFKMPEIKQRFPFKCHEKPSFRCSNENKRKLKRFRVFLYNFMYTHKC